MNIEMHPSVIKVAEFMQQNLDCNELLPVAEAIGLIAPGLWGHYEAGTIIPLSLCEEPIMATPSKQSTASGLSLGSSDVGGDSAAA